jgi:hypothetical protein
MQSSVETSREESRSPIQSAREQLSSLVEGTKLEIETFKLATSKVEDGVSLEFEFRATVRFAEKQ